VGEFDIDILRSRLKLDQSARARRSEDVHATMRQIRDPASLFDTDDSAAAGAARARETRWPHLSEVPRTGANRARPFGRRYASDEPVMDLNERHKVQFVDAVAPSLHATPEEQESLKAAQAAASERLRRRMSGHEDVTLPELELSPDMVMPPRRTRHAAELSEIPADEAEFEDVLPEHALDTEARKAEAARVNDADAFRQPKAVPGASEMLLRSLANRIALERDQLDARRSDMAAPLILSPLRRRRTDRAGYSGHIPELVTANDRI
jgi:hypothetical protein